MELLAGRYELGKALGTGATASVFAGLDRQTGRAVAIKILAGPGLGPDAAVRFEREAALLSRLSHPSLLKLLDYGRAGDRLYLVYPLVEGIPLDRWMEAGPHPPDQLLVLLEDWLDGLAELEELGLVHRDLKPGNLLVTREGRGLVLDFGLARAADSAALTDTGMVLGTPAYMAPELLTGAPASPASDLYSLGVVAYELLAGENPFAGEDLKATIDLQLHHRPRLPPAPAGLPGLAAWVGSLLAKAPGERPPGARAARATLARTGEQGPESGASPNQATRRLAAAASSPAPSASLPTQQIEAGSARLPRWRLARVATAGLFLLAAAGVARGPKSLPGGSPEPVSAAPPARDRPRLPDAVAAGLPGLADRIEAKLADGAPLDRGDADQFGVLVHEEPALRGLIAWLAQEGSLGELDPLPAGAIEKLMAELTHRGCDRFLRPLLQLEPRRTPAGLAEAFARVAPGLRADPAFAGLDALAGQDSWTGAALLEALAIKGELEALDRRLAGEGTGPVSGWPSLSLEANLMRPPVSAEALLWRVLRSGVGRAEWMELTDPVTARTLRALAALGRALRQEPAYREVLVHLFTEALDGWMEPALRLPLMVLSPNDLFDPGLAPAGRLLEALLLRIQAGTKTFIWLVPPPPFPSRPGAGSRPRVRRLGTAALPGEVAALWAALALPVPGPLAADRRARARSELLDFAFAVGNLQAASDLFRDARDEDPDARGPWRAALFAQAMTGLTSHPELLDAQDLEGLRSGAASRLAEVEDPALARAARAALETAAPGR